MNPSDNTEEYLQFIQNFANVIADTFKQFAHICRDHLKKSQNNKSEFSDLRNQLIDERKKRMELQDKIKQIFSANTNNPETTSPEDRKRPKNPFALFVADQRDKILADHPTFDLRKITAMAAIKWKSMAEQQKREYQKKFQLMSKLYQEQLLKSKQNQGNPQTNDSNLVKRQHNEPDKPNEEEEQNDKEQEIQEHIQQQQPQEEANTLLIANEEENQPTVPMETEEKEPIRPLQNILNLFHTPVNTQSPFREEIVQSGQAQNEQMAGEQNIEQELAQKEGQPQAKIESNAFQQQRGEEQASKQKFNEKQFEQKQVSAESLKVQDKAAPQVTIDPSIQIIEQVVIDPTIQ